MSAKPEMPVSGRLAVSILDIERIFRAPPA
jgi:hypothetical protein